MRTHFTGEQLLEPALDEANDILRTCVHCGFCLATCPTYVLLGNEPDSPRGRIVQMQEVLESGDGSSESVRLHMDRCLTCQSCMTTCPSGVDYVHLADTARAQIEAHRPWYQRWLRRLLVEVLTRRTVFRLVLVAGRLMRPFLGPYGHLVRGWPHGPSLAEQGGVFKAEDSCVGGVKKTAGLRVALLQGCVQDALAPGINAATIRILTRLGVEVVCSQNIGCCGAIAHHMSQASRADETVRATIKALRDMEPLDAVLANASGCGTMLKDYGHRMKEDTTAKDAQWVAALTRDISEFLFQHHLPELLRAEVPRHGTRVVYHSACSLGHGQGVKAEPVALLEAAGFVVELPTESHLCCGSAGTYNLLQPRLAGMLRRRKLVHLEATGAQVVCTGNIGCLTQLQGGAMPTMHTVELLDWALGGCRSPVPWET